MRPHIALLAAVAFVAFLAARPAPAQRERAGKPGTGNTLYGTLSVKEESPGAAGTLTFSLILNMENGNILDRQQVSANGNYRFLAVPNGIYNLVVEKDGEQVARVQLNLQELRPTDIRKDLSLEWRSNAPGAANAPRLPSADVYAMRNAENATRFEAALKAGKAQDRDRAVSLLREILKEDPNDFEAWTELGTMEFLRGKSDEADKAYAKSLEARPTYFPALLNLGKSRVARKNYDGAIEVLTRAAQAQPQSADVQYFLGESYLQIKKGSKAVGCLNEALRLDPVGKADAHLRLATLYNAANMKDKAAAEYTQFLAKKPDYPDKKKLEEYIRQNKKP